MFPTLATSTTLAANGVPTVPVESVFERILIYLLTFHNTNDFSSVIALASSTVYWFEVASVFFSLLCVAGLVVLAISFYEFNKKREADEEKEYLETVLKADFTPIGFSGDLAKLKAFQSSEAAIPMAAAPTVAPVSVSAPANTPAPAEAAIVGGVALPGTESVVPWDITKSRPAKAPIAGSAAGSAAPIEAQRLALAKEYETNERWKKVVDLVHTENENDWRQAIIEADAMLDDMLTERGYVGATLGEKLKSMDHRSFAEIGRAWDAHATRNMIAHQGANYVLTAREARRVIALYEAVFRYANYI
jgi:hypothetical protein